MKLTFLILIAAIPALLAQDKDISTGGAPSAAPVIAFPAKPEPPVISAELRAKYWRAQNELNLAESAAAKARDKAREAMFELQKSCAANLPLVLDAAGEPSCTANPPMTTETTSPAQK